MADTNRPHGVSRRGFGLVVVGAAALAGAHEDRIDEAHGLKILRS
jgi:hypothetical protein